jgi:metal-dependent hydrolase (beta-lactamase superfamily II)
VNWHAVSDDYVTEPGVSYLIKTDDATILFDVGYNRYQVAPSPLEHNMELLGVTTSQIDAIFLSHAHLDHLGGPTWEGMGTFSLGNTQVNLAGKRVYAPVALQYPGIDIDVIVEPTALMNGVASTGPIARSLFVGGIDEQALVINVKGKGLVVIVGCGHQTMGKLVQRLEEAFGEKLYGVVGDLHYPFPHGRLSIFGLDVQRRLASGEGFFRPLTRAEVDADMSLLEGKQLGLIALGGHDTSDEVLRDFERRFDGQFQRVEVGRPIIISR